MKLISHWHPFTLLALAQSLLVLLGVAYLFNWFESSENDSIRRISTASTESAVSHISSYLKRQPQSEASGQGQDLQSSFARFRKATSGFKPVQDSFVCFLNMPEGAVIYQKNAPERLIKNRLGTMPFHPLADDQASSLIELFTNQANHDAVSGIITVGDQRLLGSAQWIQKDGAILLVAQNESARIYQRGVWLNQKRTGTLMWALVLSLVLIGIPIIGLHHKDDHLRVTNKNLTRQATHNERELVRTRNAVIFGLAKLAESRDNDTGEHLDRIRKYVEILSCDLADHFSDIDEEFTRNISLASSLHDIGKVGIPDSILLKPGRLTTEERSVMQIHTLIGGECLDAIHARLGNNPFMHMARQIAYYHHERWDGEGYPHQLKEQNIPLVARIVAVADVYDALTSKRPYKRAMSHLESRAIVVAGSGTQFDPEVVAAFMRHEEEFEAISLSQQSISDEDATSRFVKLHELATASANDDKQSVS